MSPNAVFRYRARTALKNNWPIALLVVFIASLPSILTQVAGVLTGGDVTTRLMTLAEDPAFLSADAESMIAQLTAAFSEESVLSYGLFSVIAWLVAPTLTIGMHHYMMNLLRGQAGGVSAVFSRLRWFVKAICLTVLVALKTFLWSVPGMAVAIGGTTAVLSIARTAESAVNMMMVVMPAGYVLMFGLMIAAMLRYAMAVYVLADKPETGLLACIRESKAIMKQRKMQLFALELSFIIWNLLVMAVYSVVVSMFGAVIGLTVQMFLNLFVAAYQNCAIAAFYLQYVAGGDPQPVEEQPPQLTDDDPWHRGE